MTAESTAALRPALVGPVGAGIAQLVGSEQVAVGWVVHFGIGGCSAPC